MMKTTTDVATLCRRWHEAQNHLDAIDAQTGPGHHLTPNVLERLAHTRAEHVAAQEAVEEAFAPRARSTRARTPAEA
jgi:hypothetical protein